ncbi:hypothetical protein [Acetobacterium bakii]|uniref:Uncharacterized protein n=1 Tax=Acetobacterium bakii TaxID=52689 RepID=A0A0L6U0C5_9FIRM|nr:hypothetical protein [Acetobacterium bakii]KNZ41275.1 hypothetical protein AKG39_13275 [Acetobacterium bakii]
MKTDHYLSKDAAFELEISDLIEKIATTIATGDQLIDVRVHHSPLHYHPWLPELRDKFSLEREYLLAEQFILNRAVVIYTRRGTLGFSGSGFLENALNGHTELLKKDIEEHGVDLKFTANHGLTDFKIKLEGITVINLMKIL